jgi:hypothetical protein
MSALGIFSVILLLFSTEDSYLVWVPGFSPMLRNLPFPKNEEKAFEF